MSPPPRLGRWPLHGLLGIVAALMLLTGGLAVGCAPANQPIDETPAELAEAASLPRPRLELRGEPFNDFYFQVRAQAASDAEPDPRLSEAVEAWRELQVYFGSFGGGFGRLDSLAFVARSPAELLEFAPDFPETMAVRGQELPARQLVTRLAHAMDAAWSSYLEELWPEHQREIAAIRAELENRLMPRHVEAFEFMLESLGIDVPELVVPLYLVESTNPPGAMTYRTHDGPVAVVDIDQSGPPESLREVILHETCHALDSAADNSDNAFAALRSALEKRGIERSDSRWRTVPHMLMFVQAELTVRRIYDPDHVAYGDRPESDRLYERSGEVSEIVRRHWTAFLDEQIERSVAIERIADEISS